MANLKDKYCIVGVGETEFSKNSGRTTRAMAVEAVRKAILDAGLKASDVDGMMSYQNGDSTFAPFAWTARTRRTGPAWSMSSSMAVARPSARLSQML